MEELIKQLAPLLAGLQVPCSMRVLGDAYKPYCEIVRILNLHGWVTEQEVNAAVERVAGRR